MDNHPADLTGGELLVHFGTGALTPVDVLDAVTERIERRNGLINAFGDLFLDSARKAACEAERRWRAGQARPLEGLLVAVKDAQNVLGQRTTYGSPVYRDNVALRHDPMVERLLAAGAIIHGRTTTSEFCISGVCTSPQWGTTRNPWNPVYSPGGSSGGAAAALASGMTTLATGTDMGGSIRVPASACGVMGYKPPHGRNPDDPRISLDPFNHCGPLARSIRDLALMQGVTAGRHPADPASLPDPPFLPQAAGDVSGLRIAWSADLSYRQVGREVRSNTEVVVSALEAMGCTCEQVELDWGAEIDEAASVWYAFFGTSRLLLHAVEKAPQQVSPDLRRLANAVRATRQHPERLDRATSVIASMWDSWERAMRSFDLFVCPTMGVPAVRADQSMWADDFQINGVPLDPEFGYSMTHQFNMLSSCPVISMPSGVSADCLATGIQIVGRPYDEQSVFRLALALETRKPRASPAS